MVINNLGPGIRNAHDTKRLAWPPIFLSTSHILAPPPWERGSDENTNGRLRRNLPKSSDLSQYTAEDLEMIANIHNHKPRKVLGWKTPAEIMTQALRETGSIT